MKFSIRRFPALVLSVAALFGSYAFAESVVAAISVPNPQAVDINPLTQLVYVANFFDPTVSVISEKTNTVVNTISFPPGPNGNAELIGVGVNPITSRLYVADTHNTILYVLDTNTNQILTTIPGVSGPVTVNLLTNKIYVSGFFSGVSIVDGNTNRVTGSASVPFAARAAVDIAANHVFIPSANFFGDVFVLDGTTNAVLAEIPTGNFTSGVAVDFLHHLAYAANQGFSAQTSSLSVIDTNTNTVVATAATDPFPTFVQVNPFTNRIYVINQVPNNGNTPTLVDIIDGHTRQIINRLNIASTPEDSALDLIHELLYVPSSTFEGGTSNEVTAISTRPTAD